MREVIFYLAMIIEIAYVFMSQVPKKLENKYLLIGTAFICASDFTYHIGYNAINMSVSALSGTIAISIFLISFVVLNWNPSFQFASLSSDLANRLHK